MAIEKKLILNMNDFQELLLSIIFKNNYLDGVSYFSKNICEEIKNAVEEYSLVNDISDWNILLKNGEFNLEEFNKCIKYTKVKKYWADDIHYDVLNDKLYCKCDLDSLEKNIEKYDETVYNRINEIVSVIDNLYGQEEIIEVSERKYIYIK